MKIIIATALLFTLPLLKKAAGQPWNLPNGIEPGTAGQHIDYDCEI